MTEAETLNRVASIVRATPINPLEAAGLNVDLAVANLRHAQSHGVNGDTESRLLDEQEAARAEYERILTAMTGQAVDVIARRLG